MNTADTGYRVVYGESRPAWERILPTRREADAFARNQKSLGDVIFSVKKVVPGEPPQSMAAAIEAAQPRKITLTDTMSAHLSWTPCMATGPRAAGRWPTWRSLERRGLIVKMCRRKGGPPHWHKTKLGLRVHRAIQRRVKENGVQQTYTVRVRV